MTGVLYFAPGAGLGHLNRAIAICLELRKRGVAAEVVTNSPFAEGVALAARIGVTCIPSTQWERAAPRYAAERTGSLVVVDTFPFGLHGEWSGVPTGMRIVYVARRLRMENYQIAGDWGRLDATIVAEEIGAEHRRSIRGGAIVLPGPVRLAPGTVATPVPAGLDAILSTGSAWLVVHSGPPDETRSLLRLARERMPPGTPLAVISPWRVEGAGCPCFEYFPAGNITPRAAHVVTGGGYNAVTDMMFDRGRHSAVAFERRYDDQAARLASLPEIPVDGTAAAADAIASLLGARPIEPGLR